MSTDRHNAALLPLLRMIVEADPTESGQWVLLESLALGIGKLHGRTPRQTAEFVEAMAERFTDGSRS
ncbi:MAG: hypothetical protein LBV50_06945 [Novosphingobium sp.]|nr:hypothetical protein [Novosphingobium sp.]